MKPGPPPRLETERLILREFMDKDLERMHRMRSSKRVMDNIGRDPQDMEQVKELIRNCEQANKTGEMIVWVMADKQTDELIGNMGFFRIDWNHFRGEIGYSILEDYFGQGYTTEAIAAALNYGFNEAGFHSIFGNINPKNGASRRVLEKQGFVKEGYFRESYYHNGIFTDSEILSILKSDWEKR